MRRMHYRLVSVEEGKEHSPKHRGSTLRVFQFLLLFLGIGVLFSVLSMYMIKYTRVQNIVPVIRSTHLQMPCYKKNKGLGFWIKPPSSLSHNMNDSELFWRASFSPQIKEYPFKRSPKIAFMFLTRGPLPLAPLWEIFFKDHKWLYSIYVHSLPDYGSDFTASSVFYRRQIPSQVAEWGRMSMCDAERRLLANALLDISNEWFILLSEACIPLQKFSIIYRYISKSRYSFMSSYDEKGPYGRGRYNPNMAPEVNITDWRKGSQWFEVNRELAIDVIKDKHFFPKFELYCRPACYVDEHYFPTILSIQSPNLLANRSLTYVDWSRGGAHPATFGKNDINENFFKMILEGQDCLYNDQPTSTCFLFARKFAPSALEPLLEISPKVFRF